MTDNKNEALVENKVIFGEHNYNEAIDLVIARAENTLLLFDQDLKTGAYASVARYELIKHFLAKDTHTTLTLILHDADYLIKHCPKLFGLLEAYSHKMTISTTTQAAKVAKDCFILADKAHYIRRIHIDHARFKYAFDDTETTNTLLMRFNELMEETNASLSATQLGL